MSGRFKDRVVWDGNPERYDVSIILWKLQFDDNGTYTCQVKNPPDVDGLVGSIRLSVVHTGRFWEVRADKKKSVIFCDVAGRERGPRASGLGTSETEESWVKKIKALFAGGKKQSKAKRSDESMTRMALSS